MERLLAAGATLAADRRKANDRGWAVLADREGTSSVWRQVSPNLSECPSVAIVVAVVESQPKTPCPSNRTASAAVVGFRPLWTYLALVLVVR